MENDMEICNHPSEHELAARRAKINLPDEDAIGRVAATFKAIADPSRLKILFALRQGELCVYHLVEAVGGTQSAVSHQLRILRDNRIVKTRRDGQNIVYSLADEHVLAVLELTYAHMNCKENE